MQIDLQQFALVALAHFLALLSPGPDFFLVLRSAAVRGFRPAAATSLGIALANAAYIAFAATGIGLLREGSEAFRWITLVGALYLGWLGTLLIRHGGKSVPPPHAVPTQGELWRALLAGFLSGILNPKNALFYASLFTLLARRAPSAATQAFYGIWMFATVLLWDLAVAAGCRHPLIAPVFLRCANRIERLTGVVLCGIAAGVAIGALR